MQADELRKQFMHDGLTRTALHQDPYRQFEAWYAQTLSTDISEPTAMCLATVDAKGQPWQRMVLLKMYDEKGFVFFTNYTSRKAGHIALNAQVSLLFPWYALGRQVKVTGVAEKISSAESLTYFATRPRGSQLGAWASPQSQVVSSRDVLESMVNEIHQKFATGHIPLPSFWGGYRVVANSLEFWQARDSRLHDRFIYRSNGAGEWRIDRLAP